MRTINLNDASRLGAAWRTAGLEDPALAGRLAFVSATLFAPSNHAPGELAAAIQVGWEREDEAMKRERG